MRTRSAKLAAKRSQAANENKIGRPRKDGVIRYPSGKINTKAEKRQAEKAKEIVSTVQNARVKHYGVSQADASQPEVGYSLGRLYLAGHITKLQLQAGNQMCADLCAYYRLTGIPHPSARAMDMGKAPGRGGEASPKTIKAAANRMMGIEGALGIVDEQGSPVRQLTKRIVVLDEGTENWTPSMVSKLKKGLTSLVGFYGLGDGGS